jgi:hypothetical protein
MIKQVKLEQDQKEAIIKLFRKSPQMEAYIQDFMRSFKILEEQVIDGVEYYVFWSSIQGGGAIKIPVNELMGSDKSEI